MNKFIIAIIATLTLILSAVGYAGEVSSDRMILDWRTEKVWNNNGDLCMVGSFTNKRSDLTITKLNAFISKITFTKADGTTKSFIGSPLKLPMCKIPANGTKKLIFNFGKYDDTWRSWVATQEYAFTYANGMRW